MPRKRILLIKYKITIMQKVHQMSIQYQMQILKINHIMDNSNQILIKLFMLKVKKISIN
jgi:hypothetical protein